MKIEVLLIRPGWKMETRQIEKDNAFQEIKGLVGCDLLEMHIIKIGLAYFEMWLDEEGRLVDKEESAYSHRYGPLCGNVVLTLYSGDSEDEDYHGLNDIALNEINRKYRLCFYGSGESIIDLNDNEVI